MTLYLQPHPALITSLMTLSLNTVALRIRVLTYEFWRWGKIQSITVWKGSPHFGMVEKIQKKLDLVSGLMMFPGRTLLWKCEELGISMPGCGSGGGFGRSVRHKEWHEFRVCSRDNMKYYKDFIYLGGELQAVLNAVCGILYYWVL